MDNTCGLWCLCAFPYRPLSDLVGTGREEAPEMHHLPHSDYDFRQGRFRAQLLAFFFGLSIAVEPSQAFLKRDGQRNDWISSGMFLHPFGYLWKIFVLLSYIILLTEVDKIYNRLCCQQKQRVDHFNL